MADPGSSLAVGRKPQKAVAGVEFLNAWILERER
jgi:hypothetical protein